MADPFATALAAQFASSMAVAAVYTRHSTGEVIDPLRTIRYEREAGALLGPGNTNRSLKYEIRVGDLPFTPATKDTLTEPRGTFRINDVTPVGDVGDGVWLCGVQVVL